MLISCPSCATQFAVPEDALGDKGRTLKCAKCGHKWFQASPLATEPAPPPPPPPPADEPEAPHLLPGFEDFKFDTGDFAPGRDEPPREERTEPRLAEPRFADLFDEDEDDEDRMPAALSARAPRRTQQPGRSRLASRTALLWLVAAAMLSGVAATGVYVLQDDIVRLFPLAGKAMETVGLRQPIVGEGLQIRNQRVERLIEGNREILIIRGVIANVSEQPRDVPWVRAVLLDDKQVAVMDKMAKAPVDGLDAGATTVFTIRMESPHPDAKSINLVFAEPPAPRG